MINDLRDMRGDLVARVERLTAMARRATLGPALVRVGIYLSAALALGASLPGILVQSQAGLGILVLAVLPTLFPRGAWPGVTIVIAVAAWLVATMGYGEPITYARLVLLACAAYLVHTLSALAAVLPYDAVLAPGILARWALRTGQVMVLTAVVALLAVLIPGYLGTRRYLAASLVGLALMAALVSYLATLARRR